MELTPQAEARVRDAIARASTDVATVENRRRVAAAGLLKLASAWEALEPEARWWIQCQLADRADDVEPADLDVSAAARAMLAESSGKQGQQLDVIPIKAAVGELFAAYVDAGGKPEVGNRSHRSLKNKPAHPACHFVAQHLLRLFPEALNGDADMAERRADSYLRELLSRGELRSREKPSE